MICASIEFGGGGAAAAWATNTAAAVKAMEKRGLYLGPALVNPDTKIFRESEEIDQISLIPGDACKQETMVSVTTRSENLYTARKLGPTSPQALFPHFLTFRRYTSCIFEISLALIWARSDQAQAGQAAIHAQLQTHARLRKRASPFSAISATLQRGVPYPV
jgi:hypothetical protein